MGVSVGSTPSGTICEIAQNTISNCPTAMRLTADSGGLYNIHDNSISSTLPGSAGIQIVNIGTPDGGCLIVENNQFSALGNSGSFTGVGVFNSIVANSNWKVQIQNNHVDLPANASTNGFLIFATATNAICLDMQNNTVIGNAPAEGFVIAPAGSTGVINVDSLQGNIGSMAPNVGTVNLVAPGTCNCP